MAISSQRIDGRACPVCGGALRERLRAKDDNRRVSAATFTYFACGRCRTLSLAPIPEDLGRYYPRDYHTIPASNAELLRTLEPERYRIDLILPHESGGKLLEIGAGHGIFTQLAREAGFEVEAIEYDEACCEFLRREQGIRAICTASPHEAPLEPGAYDVVALWHCLEHLSEPVACLRAAARWLRPGGVLLIAVPNPESLQLRVLGRFWPHLDAPRHLRLIPRRTLARLLAAEALHEVSCTTCDRGGRQWNAFGWERALANRARRWRPRIWLGRAGRAIGRLLAPIEAGGLRGATYTSIFRKADRRP